jgi:LPS export ABC transporter protein LptC
MRKTAVWILAALLVVAAWFFWPRSQPQEPQAPAQPHSWQAQGPDLKLISPDGQIQWYLSAERIEFSEDGTRATVERLEAQLHAGNEQIRVQAPGAQVDWQEQNIEFKGPVKVRGEELSIEARSLKWQAKTRQLLAKDGVQVTTPTGKLEGQTLIWQQPQGKLIMEGGVKLWATDGS